MTRSFIRFCFTLVLDCGFLSSLHHQYAGEDAPSVVSLGGPWMLALIKITNAQRELSQSREAWIKVSSFYSRWVSELLLCVSNRQSLCSKNKSSFGGLVSSLGRVIDSKRFMKGHEKVLFQVYPRWCADTSRWMLSFVCGGAVSWSSDCSKQKHSRGMN